MKTYNVNVYVPRCMYKLQVEAKNPEEAQKEALKKVKTTSEKEVPKVGADCDLIAVVK